MYHNPIEKPTPLTFIYPAIALIAFALDGYMEANKLNKKERSTITSKIMEAIKFKR